MSMSNHVRGILLIATGHPYYGRMAYNLAMTIKSMDKNFPIAIIHDIGSLSHLSDNQRKIFDEFIFFDETAGFGTKLYIDILTPFEETLFLDADMAWMPSHSPDELFDELRDYEYTGITEGFHDRLATDEENKKNACDKYYFWAEPNEIYSKYPVKAKCIYQWRSEVIYFKNTPRVHDFFLQARKIHKEPNLETVKKFVEQVPDELAINISAAMHEIEPHKFKWSPALWIKLHGSGNIGLSDMYSGYYLLSCGSNHTAGEARKLYDRILKTAAYKLNVQHVFPLANKKDFIPERQKM